MQTLPITTVTKYAKPATFRQFIPLNSLHFKVDKPDAKTHFCSQRAMCVFFDVFVLREQGSIHFHHIKSLLSSLLETILCSRAPGGRPSDIAWKIQHAGRALTKVEDSHVAKAHTLRCRQHSQGFSYFIDHYRCMNCSLRITGESKGVLVSDCRPFNTASASLLTGSLTAHSLGWGQRGKEMNSVKLLMFNYLMCGKG